MIPLHRNLISDISFSSHLPGSSSCQTHWFSVNIISIDGAMERGEGERRWGEERERGEGELGTEGCTYGDV